MELRERKIYRVTLMGSVVNLILVIFKFVAGILGHSMAMIADAVHSLSDFLTDIVVLVFVRLSSKPQDEDHAYGHGKYETLATSFIGLALIAVGLMIGIDGIERIWLVIHGGTLEVPGWIALAAALLSILLKEIVFRVSYKVGKEVDSPAVIANAWHHRSDALSSIATGIGIGGAILLGQKWAVLDPIAAVIVSVLIIVTAVHLLGKSLGDLVEVCLPKESEDRIREIVSRDKNISDIHHLKTRRIGQRIAIEMHVRMPGDTPLTVAHNHASAIERDLRAEFGPDTHISIHLEPVKHR